MSKISNKQKEKKVKEEIKALEKQKAEIYDSNCREEAFFQVQEIIRKINLKHVELDAIISNNGSNQTYVVATALISHRKNNKEEELKKIAVIIKERSVSSENGKYIISHETDLAKAVIAAKDGGIATYQRKNIETTVRVLSYQQKKEIPI